MMHFIAQLDNIIPEDLTKQLASRFNYSEVRYFWGTHYVPRDPDTVQHMSTFICKVLGKMETEVEWVDI